MPGTNHPQADTKGLCTCVNNRYQNQTTRSKTIPEPVHYQTASSGGVKSRIMDTRGSSGTSGSTTTRASCSRESREGMEGFAITQQHITCRSTSSIQPSFLHKLWTIGLCFVLLWTFHTTMAQDTMLIQHTGYAKKGGGHHHLHHCSKHCTSMIASMEQRLHHRVRDVDHRCMKRVEAAVNANNKTAAIQHTEKLLHHVIEELQVNILAILTTCLSKNKISTRCRER